MAGGKEVKARERACRTCALSRKVKPEGACYCYKHRRIIKPEEAEWDWGCLYFCEATDRGSGDDRLVNVVLAFSRKYYTPQGEPLL